MRRGLLQEHAEIFGQIVRLVDLLIVALSGLTAYWLRFGTLAPDEQYQLAIAVAILFALFSFPTAGLYQPWRGASLWGEARRMTVAWFGLLAVLVVITYLTKTGTLYSRLWFGYWALLVFGALMLSRVVLRGTLRRLRERGFNTRTVAIAGATGKARELAEQISQAPDSGLKIAGFFDDKTERERTTPREAGVPHQGNFEALVNQVRNGRIDIIHIALPMQADPEIQTLVSQLADTTASVYFAPDFRAVDLMQSRWTRVGSLPVVSVFETPLLGIEGWTKRLEDVILSVVILLIAALPMILIALAIKLSSGGPVLFRQDRYGLSGRRIKVWKFRTMRVEENGDYVPQATKNDPRVTSFGAFLRRTSLDELPQFFNVLKGDMSIVGPRPHAVTHNEEYRNLIFGYMLRHKVKPGITGWAQVNGWRGETDTLEKMEKRIEYDLWYIRNWSLWLDVMLIVKTVLTGFRTHGAY